MSLTDPRAVPIPKASRITSIYDRVSLSDAYAIDLPMGACRNPEVLARFVFSHQPRWILVLMQARDILVAGFGLKTARGLKSDRTDSSRIGIFKVYETNEVEVIMGEDDKHLNFRVSALCPPQAESNASGPRLVIATVVQCHNALGRAYIGLIAPFHRLVVQACLRHAAKMGWPNADGTKFPVTRNEGV